MSLCLYFIALHTSETATSGLLLGCSDAFLASVDMNLSVSLASCSLLTMISIHTHICMHSFEGGLGDMDASLALQNAEGWLAHHITLSVLLVGALVCFMWRWKAVQRRSAPSRAGGGSVGPSSALGVFLSTR